jgi:hypothetical protein
LDFRSGVIWIVAERSVIVGFGRIEAAHGTILFSPAGR